MTWEFSVGYSGENLHQHPAGRAASQHDIAVDLRPVPAFFMARHLSKLERPERMLAGTSLVNLPCPLEDVLAHHWPKTLTVRDYLTIIVNLVTIGPDAGYHIDYYMAGVPVFGGALDLGMRFAPSAYDALDLMCRYGSDRPGYVQLLLHEEGDDLIFKVRPKTDLGAAAPVVLETAILSASRLIDRHFGRKLRQGLVELSYPSPPYLRRLKEALSKQIVFNAGRNSLSIPIHGARAPSIVYDEAQWQIALRTCEEELTQGAYDDNLAEVRQMFVDKLLQAGKPPKLSALADALGVSDRTLIRRFRAAGISFQQFKDLALLGRATELLSQSDLNIEEIAEKLGFADASGLHRSFKRWIGRTPRQFREEQRAKQRADR